MVYKSNPKGGDPKGASGQRPPTPAVPVNQHKQLAGAVKGK